MKKKTRQDLLEYDYEGLMDLYLKLQKQLEKESSTLCDMILNQKDFYHGHGQIEFSSETSINALGDLLKELEKRSSETDRPMNDLFFLKLFKEHENFSGSIYQQEGMKTGEDRLWASFDNIVLGDDDEE